MRLVTVTRTQGNNRALKEGTVAPKRYDLDFHDVPVLVDAFRRMVRTLDYDVCEMAITTYLCAKAAGKPFTALPVFLVRGFHHGAIVVNRNAGIAHPKDLEGRRVGVNRGYTVTTGVWARGILHDAYGVDLNAITWVRSGDEHVTEVQMPANVVDHSGDRSLADLVIAGELDAAIGIEVDHPDVVPLIPDATGAGFAALRARGHYPINHLVVVKDELLAAYPDLAVDVFEAFTESKNVYLSQLRDGAISKPTAVDVMHRNVLEITGRDPLPYGVEANRHVIDELIEHAVDQHILDRRPDIGSLFAEGTLDLTG